MKTPEHPSTQWWQSICRKGNQKSKLETYIQNQLIILYPILEFHFNRRDAINGELDIYIPSLKLAFELNGIFHYEPVFGPEKLTQIQNNDNRKFQACIEREIELCIIDSSKDKYFKEKTAKPFLDIIVKIINDKLASPVRFERTTQNLENSCSIQLSYRDL